MINRTSKYLAMAALLGCAATGHAGSASVSPALAACSKALVETLAKSEALPTYSVKAPSPRVSSNTDPNSFTVLAHTAKSKQLLAKASCKATPAGEVVEFKPLPVN